jgi:hypothetical protein
VLWWRWRVREMPSALGVEAIRVLQFSGREFADIPPDGDCFWSAVTSQHGSTEFHRPRLAMPGDAEMRWIRGNAWRFLTAADEGTINDALNPVTGSAATMRDWRAVNGLPALPLPPPASGGSSVWGRLATIQEPTVWRIDGLTGETGAIYWAHAQSTQCSVIAITAETRGGARHITVVAYGLRDDTGLLCGDPFTEAPLKCVDMSFEQLQQRWTDNPTARLTDLVLEYNNADHFNAWPTTLAPPPPPIPPASASRTPADWADDWADDDEEAVKIADWAHPSYLIGFRQEHPDVIRLPSLLILQHKESNPLPRDLPSLLVHPLFEPEMQPLGATTLSKNATGASGRKKPKLVADAPGLPLLGWHFAGHVIDDSFGEMANCCAAWMNSER